MTKNQTNVQTKDEHALLKSPWFKNKLVNCGIYMGCLAILLLVNYFAVLGFKASVWIFLDLILMVLLVSPIFFFKKTMFDRIYLSIIFGLIMVMIVININFYKFFGTVFSIRDLIFSIHNVGQAWYYIKQWNWVVTSIDIVLFGIEVAALIVFNTKFAFQQNRWHKNPKRKAKNIFAGVVMGASLVTYEFGMGMWTMSEKHKGVDSIKYVNYNANYHFNNLGMLSFYVRELRQYLFDRGVSDQEVINWIKQSYLVKDKFSGCLDKPNIFVILIETGESYMINEYTTPNLWKLVYGSSTEEEYKGGLIGAHNYSYNHTNVSNIISVTGSYPASLIRQKRYYSMPFALPQILRKQGYSTRFYYDIIPKEDTYFDMQFAKTMGFDNRFAHNELLPGVEPWTYEKMNFIRDTEVAEAILKDLTKFHTEHPTDKIYSHWMTMLMHMENVRKSTNYKLIDGLYETYGSTLKEYEEQGKWTNPCTTADARNRYEIWTLKTMDFDKALGQIMDFFYKSDDPMLQNTIMVAFGDHSWFEHAGNNRMDQMVKKIYNQYNIKQYSTMMAMYHPTLSAKIEADTTGLFDGHKLLKMTSPACIVPTVLDLMGIPYIRNIYQDQSVFDLCNQDTYDKANDEIYYSTWLSIYMNEHYTSRDGANITNVIDDDGTKAQFMQKVKNKLYQLRVLENIYFKKFFDKYKYEDYLPKEFNCDGNLAKDYFVVKYY